MKKFVIIYKNGMVISVDMNVSKLKNATLGIHGMSIIVNVK